MENFYLSPGSLCSQGKKKNHRPIQTTMVKAWHGVENFGGKGRFHPMTDIWDGDMSLGVIFCEESIGAISRAVGLSLP